VGGQHYPGMAAASVDSPGKNVVGNLTWTISPTIVNELEFVYAQGTIFQLPERSICQFSSALSALQRTQNSSRILMGAFPQSASRA